MHPLRRRAGRRANPTPTPDEDTRVVDQYVHAANAAAIDFLDLPFDHTVQQNLIELLLHSAPPAGQALQRLHASSATLSATTQGACSP